MSASLPIGRRCITGGADAGLVPIPPRCLPQRVARQEGLMSRPTRCITIAVASLAIAAPAASAMVVDPVPTSGTTAPTQDLRNPDQRVPQQSVTDMHAS